MKGKHEVIRVDFDGVAMFVRDFGEVGESTDCDCGDSVRMHLWEVPTGILSKDYFLACPQCHQNAMIPKSAAEELNRGAGLDALGHSPETSSDLERLYRQLQRDRENYLVARIVAKRLTCLCRRNDSSLSASRLVHERLQDKSLDAAQVAYWEFARLVLLFEAQEIDEYAKTEAGTPLRVFWDSAKPCPPGWALGRWEAFKKGNQRMHEPLAVALGCDVDDL